MYVKGFWVQQSAVLYECVCVCTKLLNLVTNELVASGQWFIKCIRVNLIFTSVDFRYSFSSLSFCIYTNGRTHVHTSDKMTECLFLRIRRRGQEHIPHRRKCCWKKEGDLLFYNRLVLNSEWTEWARKERQMGSVVKQISSRQREPTRCVTHCWRATE